MKPAVTIATIVLSLIALGHLLRLAFGIEVVIGGVTIPIWVSAPACTFAALLAIWLVREARASKKPDV